MAEFAKMVKDDYGLKIKAIRTRNPQANAIIERVHQTMGNIIRTFDVQTMGSDDPWAGILAATMFTVSATYHTTLQASPMQLVFGQDAILNVKHITNWEHIKQRKQTRINENNEHENKSRPITSFTKRSKHLPFTCLSRSPPNEHSALPMPGPYYVDANLIHCRVHPYGEQIPESLLKNKFGLPVEPDLNVRFTPHKFQLPPF
jgi:hypothetical protein